MLFVAAFSIFVACVFAVLLGAGAYLFSDRGGRFARTVAAAGVIAGAVLILGGFWLVYSWARWRAGLSCPDRGAGAGAVRYGGWGNGSSCDYPSGGDGGPVRVPTGFFFDPWWAGALLATTVLTIAGAVWLLRQARFSTNRSS